MAKWWRRQKKREEPEIFMCSPSDALDAEIFRALDEAIDPDDEYDFDPEADREAVIDRIAEFNIELDGMGFDDEVRLSNDQHRHMYDKLSDHIGEWQGLPIPLGGENLLVLNKSHPLKDLYIGLNEIEPYVYDDRPIHTCDPEPGPWIVNQWFSRERNCMVYVIKDEDGKHRARIRPRSPDRSMERLDLWFSTMGACDAWDLEAEYKARETLRDMLNERQWMQYELTGSFLEESPRSRLVYMFRRLRPTIALTPRNKHDVDRMHVLAVLCMHPIGYYMKSWAGCMVPTDDVIAHLSFMRGDEARYWSEANQHKPAAPEAGL